MPTSTPLPEQVRFGEFQLNLRTRELKKNGEKADLQEQPFLVLTLLLERPGDLVTREELIQRLWPSGTFVDFEHSLNKAVKRLREALKDSAELPRFIETLPRRGYRFIGAVVSGPEVSETSEPETKRVTAPEAFDPPSWRWQQIGAIAGTILIGALGFAVIWAEVRHPVSTNTKESVSSIRSLAVLPLENLSGDASQGYFADGMTDELITDLGQIGSLRVISRTSAMQYRGTHKSLPEIARELHVDAVVEGTVMRSGDRVRITAQLIEASADRHLWAQSYEREAKDVLDLQNQVAREIAEQIRVKLTPEQRAILNTTRPVKPEAHEMYLRGYYEKSTADGRRRGLEYFKKAAELDPTYAAAQVAIGRRYVGIGHMLALPPQQAFPAAREAAAAALRIDDSLAEAHLTMGGVAYLYDWDFARAQQEIVRALELNPNSAFGHGEYAEFLALTGKADESVAEAKRVVELDPLSLIAKAELAGFLYWARRYDEAIGESNSVISIDPDFFGGHLYLGLSLEAKQQYPAAIRELERSTELWQDKLWIGFVAHAKAVSGDKDGARRILAELEQESRRAYISPWWAAVIYSGLGENEKAFEYLDKSYRGREHDLVFSKVWPMLDGLRSDPRYVDLMRRVGLPE